MSNTAAKVLKLNGKPFDPHPPSPALKKLIQFLDGCPVDEIFTSEQVAKVTGVANNYVKDMCRHELMADYCQIVSKIKYYGNRKAIAELRKQVGQ